MYYLCSENQGADQLHGYREADLCLCFRTCKYWFSHDAAQIMYFKLALFVYLVLLPILGLFTIRFNGYGILEVKKKIIFRPTDPYRRNRVG